MHAWSVKRVGAPCWREFGRARRPLSTHQSHGYPVCGLLFNHLATDDKDSRHRALSRLLWIFIWWLHSPMPESYRKNIKQRSRRHKDWCLFFHAGARRLGWEPPRRGACCMARWGVQWSEDILWVLDAGLSVFFYGRISSMGQAESRYD